MVKYRVKIDDSELDSLFTFDELLSNGILDDYDENILVRANEESSWVIARDYPYGHTENDKQSNGGIDDSTDGTLTINDNSNTFDHSFSLPDGYCIDEYGQVVRTGGVHNSRLELSKDALYFTDKGETLSINVSTNGSWDISFISASWIHLVKNGDILNVSVDGNTSSERRESYFKLKSGSIEKRVSIYQSSRIPGSNPSTPSNDNDGCWSWLVVFVIVAAILGAILS